MFITVYHEIDNITITIFINTKPFFYIVSYIYNLIWLFMIILRSNLSKFLCIIWTN